MTTRPRLYQWQMARAKEVDESLRERAFLPILENINGVTVKQFTLRHFTILSHLQSPFIYGGERRIEDVGQFLWVVSPRYDTLPPEESAQKRFLTEIVLHPHWERFYRGIDRYLQRTFIDPPPTCKGGKEIAVSYAASVLHALMHAYGGDEEKWMDKPITRLFQFLKILQVEANPKTPQFNPFQDRVWNRFS